jgi:hypothetical protein
MAAGVSESPFVPRYAGGLGREFVPITATDLAEAAVDLLPQPADFDRDQSKTVPLCRDFSAG